MTEQHIRRFWSKVYMVPCGGCWLWEAGQFKQGYGAFDLNGASLKAHRVALEWTVGPAPEDKPQALHSCDNKICVNPNHLRWGTHEENMQDKVDRNRTWRGGKCPIKSGVENGRAKVTEEDVLQIRRLRREGWSLKRIGQRYGVSISQVFRIAKQESWTHL